MIDYHIHLENGPLTLEWLGKFWEAAQKRGISEIGVTEHCHKFQQFKTAFAYLKEGVDSYEYMRQWLKNDFQTSLDDYLELLTKAQQKGIPVKIGLEVDYLSDTEAEIKEILSNYSFDYIIGSVHIIGKWGFDYYPQAWQNQDVYQAYKNYYAVLYDAVCCDLFDIIAHFDLIKVFGHHSSISMDQVVDTVLKAMSRRNTCMEISTAGLRKPVKEIYPTEAILQKAFTYQIPIVISSDAHYPEDVGADWERATKLARRCGYKEYRVFSQRHSFAEKLPK